ncbi:SLAM family member 7-like isoform X5 [Salvelinus alpinus]|uniref:SLAM family member 7-like isoform X5 n=1 Tax=Salvelinus alpinus TaxID=8036 RepID=UPI0039FD2DB7
MSKLTLIRLCFWLYLVRTVVSEEDLYHKVGGELVLKPDKSTVPHSITSILWKHGKDKVAEWDKDFGGLDIYGAFKERTTLNQTTAELRISGLMKTDSGVYSVEFNSKLLDKTYKLSVIKAVPKPTITSSCNANKTSCTLTCEGDTTDAEPVTYSWKVGEGAWEVVDKQMNVSKSNTGKSANGYKYTCKLKNAVSEEVSEPVGEVFGPEPFNIGAVVALVVVTIVVIVLTGLLVWKKKKGSDVVQPEQDKAEKGQGKEDDKAKANGSAAPGGDLNAAEKGEANGEGSVLLNEDTVKYDNGKGAAEENSAL